MTSDPIPTDIFEYLLGEGFVMAVTKSAVIGPNALELSAIQVVTSDVRHHPRPVWPSIENDVADLERLLR